MTVFLGRSSGGNFSAQVMFIEGIRAMQAAIRAYMISIIGGVIDIGKEKN